MKTAKEWLDLMESPEKEQAIENMKKDCEKWSVSFEEDLQRLFYSFECFLSSNFNYDETEQKHEYWINIEKKYSQCTE